MLTQSANRPIRLIPSLAMTCIACATASLNAGAVDIAVVNPSFESPPIGLCSFGSSASGWIGAQVWHCGVLNECPFDAFPTGPSHGLQVGFTNSSAPLSQILAETLAPNQTYTLRVDVGVRDDAFHMEDYRVRLLAGPTVLVEDLGSLDPDPGTWETSVLFFATPPNHPAIGQPLKIELVRLAGSQGNFDHVRLTKGERGPGGVLGDLNNDGLVNAADLAMLLGAWGPCLSCANCPADVTGDCQVDAADLAVMLGAWTG